MSVKGSALEAGFDASVAQNAIAAPNSLPAPTEAPAGLVSAGNGLSVPGLGARRYIHRDLRASQSGRAGLMCSTTLGGPRAGVRGSHVGRHLSVFTNKFVSCRGQNRCSFELGVSRMCSWTTLTCEIVGRNRELALASKVFPIFIFTASRLRPEVCEPVFVPVSVADKSRDMQVLKLDLVAYRCC